MSKQVRWMFWLAWLALAVWGGWGMYQRFTTGHELAAYGSYVPWGLWVSVYIYFIGISTGAFMLFSLIDVFGLKSMAHLGRTALFVAAVTLPLALLSIWVDLGHMWRFYEVFTRPNFHSMMTWMVWLYNAYFILILVELWYEMRHDLATLADGGGTLSPLYRVLCLGWRPGPRGGDTAWAVSTRRIRGLACIGIPVAVAFHSGALFATLSARSYWHSSLYPILFLTGALVSGGALLLGLTSLLSKGNHLQARQTLSRIVLALLCFYLLLEWAELLVPLWYGVGPEHDLSRTVLFGRFWYVFWIFHLALGSFVPLVVLVWRPGMRWANILAGGLIAVTFMAVRFNLVIPGEVTPELAGLRDAYIDRRLRFDYVPSAFEWSVVGFVVALGICLFFLGWKLLPIAGTDVRGDAPNES